MRLTNSHNGDSVVVRVNDRGLFHGSRLIDLSTAAARAIGLIRSGTGQVNLALTLEGSGQWLGYQRLIDREGAGLPAKVAVQGFGLRCKWWSQQQGFASFAALDRLAPGAWVEQAFKGGNTAIGEVFDEAIADQMD